MTVCLIKDDDDDEDDVTYIHATYNNLPGWLRLQMVGRLVGRPARTDVCCPPRRFNMRR